MRHRLDIIFLSLAFLAAPVLVHAQNNMDRIMVGAGALYERGLDGTIAWEHEGINHNMWEFFLVGYLKWGKDPDAGHVTRQSFWESYNTFTAGIAYKPCVFRRRNHNGHIRVGASMGSDRHNFIAFPTVGYEHDFALRNRWHLYIQLRTEMAIGKHKDLFRTGVAFGVKIPINGR